MFHTIGGIVMNIIILHYPKGIILICISDVFITATRCHRSLSAITLHYSCRGHWFGWY